MQRDADAGAYPAMTPLPKGLDAQAGAPAHSSAELNIPLVGL